MGLGIVIVAVALVVIIVITLIVVGVRAARTEERPEQEPDTMFMLGVVFLGSGIALFIAVGPAMLGLPVLGAIFMAVGAQRMRRQG